MWQRGFDALVGQLFDPINEVYHSIRDEAVGDDEFDVHACIEHCKKISRPFSKYFKMNYRLNQLANYFDEAMNERRRERAKEKDIHWVLSKHVFLISPDRSPDEASVFSKKYSKMLPPDERLIYIELDKSENNVLLSVLHEMGHFIGVRMRYDRFHIYFQQILLNALCDQLWRRMCYAYNGYAYSHEQVDFIQDTIFSEKSVKFAKAAHAFLSENVMRFLYREFEQLYKAVLTELKAKITDMEGNEQPVVKLKQRELAAVEMCFFESVRPIVLGVLNYILSNEGIRQTVLTNALSYAEQNEGGNENAAALFVEYLADAWRDIKEQTAGCNYDEEKKTPDWYQSCEAQFEEPAADVFMLRVTNTPIKGYIKHIVQLYQTRHQKTTEVSLLNLFANPALNSRVLGVCLAANASDSDFCCTWDFIDKRLPQNYRRRQRYEVRQLLRRRYANTDKASESFLLVAKYIKQLWDDPLYSNFANMNKWWIDKINRRSPISFDVFNEGQSLKWNGNRDVNKHEWE